MNFKYPVNLRGTGSYVPEEVVTNDFFSSYLDTSDEWIKQRTGIKTRRRVSENESTRTVAIEAARHAIEDAGISPSDIDLIVMCTATPDYTIPTTAGLVQHGLGIKDVPAFDLGATCSGLVYGIDVACNMIGTGAYKRALVIGADSLTRFTDYQDRSTCILFGDGAGAVVLEPSSQPDHGILHSALGADGEFLKCFWVPGGGSREPTSERTVNERLHYMRMRGRELFKLAVSRMEALVDDALSSAGVSADDIALLVPHQSNWRIMEAMRKRLGMAPEKLAVNIDRFGNTSSASIGIALDHARREGRVKSGDLVLLVAFGAGVTWGTILWRL